MNDSKRPSHPYRDPGMTLDAIEESATTGANAQDLLDVIAAVRAHLDAGSFDEFSRGEIAAWNQQFARIRHRLALRGPDPTINATIIGAAVGIAAIVATVAASPWSWIGALVFMPVVAERLYVMMRARGLAIVLAEFLLLEEHFRMLPMMSGTPAAEPVEQHTPISQERTGLRVDPGDRASEAELQPEPGGPNVPGKKKGHK